MIATLILLVALFAACSAFAPSGAMRSGSKSMLKMQFEDELGVLPPVGFWDPLGLSAGIDEERFKDWRRAELKHGRVSMAAVTGYLVQEVARWPGYADPATKLTFADVPNGVAALKALPFSEVLFVIGFVGFLETVLSEEVDDEPGNFGTGYLGKSLEGDERVEKLTKELQNGRLAMLGIGELLFHDINKPLGEGLFTLHHL
jgi:hypothetical protein